MTDNELSQLNKRIKVYVIIMNLSNSFDTLIYNLLVAKLKEHGLGSKALSFDKSYLKNR